MNNIIQNPFFGIFLTIICFQVCVYLKKYIKSSLFNPVFIATILIIIILLVCNISYDDYFKSASFLSALLLPATCVLAIHIYNQKEILKKHFVPILIGCSCGALTSIVTIIIFSRLLGIDKTIENSLIPKSITTAIAIDVSIQLKGIISITIIAVIFTGMIGAIFAPLLIKLFKFDDPIVQGCAIGTASHALGTTKAIEIGEIQTAIASISIILTGIATVLFTLLIT